MASLITACQIGDLSQVMYLVSQGANVRASDDLVIRYASEFGHLEVVKYLVSQGADVRASDDKAIIWASAYGHLEVVKYLVSQGANIRADNDSAIKNASFSGHLEVVKYLVSQGASITNLGDVYYEKVEKYLSFCKKMEEKVRIKAQKKIYYWWIPICYDVSRECGRRMAQKNLEEYTKLIL